MKKLLMGAVLLALPALASAQATTGRQYVRMAGASDQYEIQSSQLVLASSRNPAIRAYAQDMIRDHRKSTADVKRAAAQGRVVAGPPRLNATGVRNVAALRRARGATRDALYVQQQKVSHRMALNLQQGYARNGDVAPLRRTAATIVPVVQHHLGMLRSM